MSEFEYTTDSGINVRIGVAPFELAGRLKNVVVKELKTSGANFGIIAGGNIESITPECFDAMAQAILSIAGSVDVERALFPCLSKSTYDDAKITPETFDDLKAREEYFKIVSLCIKLNIFPFFKNLGSLYSTLMR